MRIIALLVASILLLGCISFGERMSNDTNGTGNATAPEANQSQNTAQNASQDAGQNITQNETNQTLIPPPKTHERYVAEGFSFEYPINMAAQQSNGSNGGIFSGTHNIDGRTGEMLIVTYINTSSVYGMNKEEIFRTNPTKTASDFLVEDKASDPAGNMLNKAFDVGNITTFGLARDAFGAQLPFKIRFGDSNITYTGYALSVYIPERSIHAKVRIVALDSGLAESMRDDFLLSFRID
jgi:hypothetical protein